MNTQTKMIYDAIVNEEHYINTVMRGMLNLARAYLGHSVKMNLGNPFFPFRADIIQMKDANDYENLSHHYEDGSGFFKFATVKSGLCGNKDDKVFLASITSLDDSGSANPIYQIFDDFQFAYKNDDESYNVLCANYDHISLTKALFVKYFPQMMIYATNNTYLKNDWNTMSACNSIDNDKFSPTEKVLFENYTPPSI